MKKRKHRYSINPFPRRVKEWATTFEEIEDVAAAIDKVAAARQGKKKGKGNK